jgi:hypothetical protein
MLAVSRFMTQSTGRGRPLAMLKLSALQTQFVREKVTFSTSRAPRVWITAVDQAVDNVWSRGGKGPGYPCCRLAPCRQVVVRRGVEQQEGYQIRRFIELRKAPQEGRQ